MCYIWGRGEMHTGFWWGRLKEGDHLEDLGLEGRIILKLILKNTMWIMHWIDLTQDRVKWQAVVNVVMNLWVPLNARNFLTS